MKKRWIKITAEHTLIDMPSLSAPETLLDSLALLLREISFTGTLLLETLSAPMQGLSSGRSPRTLGLEEKVQQTRSLLSAMLEMEAEASALFSSLASFAPSLRKLPLEIAPWLESAKSELSRWTRCSQRVELLLKKLQLVSQEEKITVLGKAPILEAWEEAKAALD